LRTLREVHSLIVDQQGGHGEVAASRNDAARGHNGYKAITCAGMDK
jgi:hypothetical protein